MGGIAGCSFVVVLVICLQRAGSLQCYTCTAEDTNANCNSNEAPVLQTCPSRDDRCLTQVIYSAERGKLRIDKYCSTQEGCDAAAQQLGKRYFCEKHRPGWGCLECCDSDRCNLSGAVSLLPLPAHWTGLLCLIAALSR